MKKLTAILLTMILALSMTSTAFAAEITEGDGNPESEEVTTVSYTHLTLPTTERV